VSLPLRSDCSRCAALCCIAFAAEEMPGFAASKNAGEPCPNLDHCGACRIYTHRSESGFAGCIAFECFGAGQFVTQTDFGGRDWRQDPALLAPMTDAFLAVRRLFELNYLVDHARNTAALNEQSRSELDAIGGEVEALAKSRDAAALRTLEARLRAVYATFA